MAQRASIKGGFILKDKTTDSKEKTKETGSETKLLESKAFITGRNFAILFLLFSIAGWIYEVVLGFIHYGIYLNRGYCFGPWLVIYGFGGMILYSIFRKPMKKKLKVGKVDLRPLTIIIYIALLATVIELAATYILQFNNIPYNKLWDYHKYPFNFEGRIALRPSVRFGLLGAGMFYFALPLYDKFVKMKNQKVCNIITAVAVGLFVIDLLFRIKYGNNYTGPA